MTDRVKICLEDRTRVVHIAAGEADGSLLSSLMAKAQQSYPILRIKKFRIVYIYENDECDVNNDDDIHEALSHKLPEGEDVQRFIVRKCTDVNAAEEKKKPTTLLARRAWFVGTLIFNFVMFGAGPTAIAGTVISHQDSCTGFCQRAIVFSNLVCGTAATAAGALLIIYQLRGAAAKLGRLIYIFGIHVSDTLDGLFTQKMQRPSVKSISVRPTSNPETINADAEDGSIGADRDRRKPVQSIDIETAVK